MRTCYVNINPDDVKNCAEWIVKNYQDSVICLAPIKPISTHSPSKNKKYFSIKLEVMLPVDAIKGDGAILDFGGMMLLRLPKDRIAEQFKKV